MSRNAESVSSSDCTFSLTELLSIKDNKISLEYMEIYNTIPIIGSSNNKLDFSVGASNFTATITIGSYSAIQLATEIQNQMNTVSSGFTVTYNNNTRKLTFANSSTFTLLFLSGTNASSSCYRECGYISSNGLLAVNSSAAVTSSISPYPVNLTLPLQIYIDIQQFETNVRSTDQQDQYSFITPFSVAPGSLMQYSAKQYFDQTVTVRNNTISFFNVKFYARGGKAVDLQNSEWIIIFRYN
jgi:hypothetical protein